MAITVHASISALAISTSEISILSGTTTLQNDTTKGIFQLELDVGAAGLAKDDKFLVKIKDKCISGGTQRVLMQSIIGHSASGIYLFPAVGLLWGWDATIQRVSGVDRNWTAKVYKVGGCSEHASMSAVLVSTSEISILSGTTTLQSDTTVGVYQLIVDGFAMVKGDVFNVRTKDKVLSGGTQRELHNPIPLHGVQSELFLMPWVTLKEGWDTTLVRTGGADANFTASVRKAA